VIVRVMVSLGEPETEREPDLEMDLVGRAELVFD
jgi:hypothetical protein